MPLKRSRYLKLVGETISHVRSQLGFVLLNIWCGQAEKPELVIPVHQLICLAFNDEVFKLFGRERLLFPIALCTTAQYDATR